MINTPTYRTPKPDGYIEIETPCVDYNYYTYAADDPDRIKRARKVEKEWNKRMQKIELSSVREILTIDGYAVTAGRGSELYREFKIEVEKAIAG